MGAKTYAEFLAIILAKISEIAPAHRVEMGVLAVDAVRGIVRDEILAHAKQVAEERAKVAAAAQAEVAAHRCFIHEGAVGLAYADFMAWRADAASRQAPGQADE